VAPRRRPADPAGAGERNRRILEGQHNHCRPVDCTRKTQLICLPAYLEPRLARDASYTWAALSSACHYHQYDLAPTAAELSRWIDSTAALLTVISDNTPGSAIDTSTASSNAT
jgi:hypothetical protein